MALTARLWPSHDGTKTEDVHLSAPRFCFAKYEKKGANAVCNKTWADSQCEGCIFCPNAALANRRRKLGHEPHCEDWCESTFQTSPQKVCTENWANKDCDGCLFCPDPSHITARDDVAALQ